MCSSTLLTSAVVAGRVEAVEVDRNRAGERSARRDRIGRELLAAREQHVVHGIDRERHARAAEAERILRVGGTRTPMIRLAPA